MDEQKISKIVYNTTEAKLFRFNKIVAIILHLNLIIALNLLNIQSNVLVIKFPIKFNRGIKFN
jgi:hypothetical protein